MFPLYFIPITKQKKKKKRKEKKKMITCFKRLSPFYSVKVIKKKKKEKKSDGCLNSKLSISQLKTTLEDISIIHSTFARKTVSKACSESSEEIELL